MTRAPRHPKLRRAVVGVLALASAACLATAGHSAQRPRRAELRMAPHADVRSVAATRTLTIALSLRIDARLRLVLPDW